MDQSDRSICYNYDLINGGRSKKMCVTSYPPSPFKMPIANPCMNYVKYLQVMKTSKSNFSKVVPRSSQTGQIII